MLIIRPLAYILLWLHILFLAITFGGSVYETLVINSVWYSDLPGSLDFMRNPEYSVKPGRFWQAFGPIPGLVALLALIFNLFIRGRRLLIAISFLCVLINTLTTIFYFVPILMIIFAPDGGGRSGEELTQLALNWVNGTWGRIALLLVSLIVSILAVGRPFTPIPHTEHNKLGEKH